PGEEPFTGGLLVAEYGEGSDIYTSLVWYRQIQSQVPGGYRMFGNLISYPRVRCGTARAAVRSDPPFPAAGIVAPGTRPVPLRRKGAGEMHRVAEGMGRGPRRRPSEGRQKGGESAFLFRCRKAAPLVRFKERSASLPRHRRTVAGVSFFSPLIPVAG